MGGETPTIAIIQSLMFRFPVLDRFLKVDQAYEWVDSTEVRTAQWLTIVHSRAGPAFQVVLGLEAHLNLGVLVEVITHKSQWSLFQPDLSALG